MELDPQVIGVTASYKLLIGCVVPRPIAWVSSLGADGIPNLAPFSFFMGVCNDPPTIAFSSGRRENGSKDTVRNLEHTGDFVVNVVDDGHAEAMNATSGEYPPEVDEFAYFHVRDDVYDAKTGRIDIHRLQPVGRLAGHQYAHIHYIFEIKRPNENYKG